MENSIENPNSLTSEDKDNSFPPFYRTELLKKLPTFPPEELKQSFAKNYEFLKNTIKSEVQDCVNNFQHDIISFFRSILSLTYDFFHDL